MTSTKKDILCMVHSAWGHARPMCSLASQIAQQPGHHVTIICIPFIFDRILKELAMHFPEKRPEEIEELVTVITITENNAEFMELFREEYYDALTAAFATRSIKCGKTGKTYAISTPSLVLGEMLNYETMSIARKVLSSNIKCFAFVPVSAYMTLVAFGPEKYGGFGDFEAKTAAEMQKSGNDIMAASATVFNSYTGSVINVPGLPQFFDYERAPQATSYDQYAFFYLPCHKYLNDCDGAIIASSCVFEPGAIRTLKQWFGETNRPLYAIGPLLPMKHYEDGRNDLVAGESHVGNEVIDFLDNALARHGERTVVYVSLGTVVWPTRPEMIYSLVDELIAAKIPFLFSHASSQGKNIPEEVKEKMKMSGLGLLSTWSPQREVLAHPATGWFFSHCGQNGVLEAITFGVPIIAYPSRSDQPLNAMLISLVHEIGYELLQGRSGERGLKKPYRVVSEDDQPKDSEAAWRVEIHNVLERARGEDGERKRANVLKMKERILASWQEGGETMNEFRSFLNSIRGS